MYKIHEIIGINSLTLQKQRVVITTECMVSLVADELERQGI